MQRTTWQRWADAGTQARLHGAMPPPDGGGCGRGTLNISRSPSLQAQYSTKPKRFGAPRPGTPTHMPNKRTCGHKVGGVPRACTITDVRGTAAPTPNVPAPHDTTPGLITVSHKEREWRHRCDNDGGRHPPPLQQRPPLVAARYQFHTRQPQVSPRPRPTLIRKRNDQTT